MVFITIRHHVTTKRQQNLPGNVRLRFLKRNWNDNPWTESYIRPGKTLVMTWLFLSNPVKHQRRTSIAYSLARMNGFLLWRKNIFFLPRNIPHAFIQLNEKTRTVVSYIHAGKIEAFCDATDKWTSLPSKEKIPKVFADHGMKVAGEPLHGNWLFHVLKWE